MHNPELYTHYLEDEIEGCGEHVAITTEEYDFNVVEILGFDEEGTLFFKDFEGIKYQIEFYDKLTTYSLLDEGL